MEAERACKYRRPICASTCHGAQTHWHRIARPRVWRPVIPSRGVGPDCRCGECDIRREQTDARLPSCLTFARFPAVSMRVWADPWPSPGAVTRQRVLSRSSATARPSQPRDLDAVAVGVPFRAEPVGHLGAGDRACWHSRLPALTLEWLDGCGMFKPLGEG